MIRLLRCNRLPAIGGVGFDCRVVALRAVWAKRRPKELTARVLSQRYCVLKSQGNYNNEIGLPLTLLELRPEHERGVGNGDVHAG